MNFGKIYIKSGLFLIQVLLSANLLYSQEYILEYSNSLETSKEAKKFNNYRELILSIDDTLSFIKKQGYFGAKVDSLVKLDSLNYKVKINKNQRVKYVEISNKDELDENILGVIRNYGVKNELIEFDKIDSFAKEISKILSEKGYPFSKIGFKNYELIDSSLIKSDIDVNYGTKRNIDKVVVKGYEKYPKNFINNIFKPGKNKSLDVDKALIQSSLIEKTRFARNKRDPEILFTKDSTTLYLYIEKIKINSFDGFISFDTDENSGKLNIGGYAKISLNNNFDRGEKLNFDFRSQENQDRSLNSDIYIPYTLGSPLSLNYGLNLIQKDSTYTSTENLIDLDISLGNSRTGLGYQIKKSTVNREIENVEDFKSRQINIFSDYSLLENQDKLIPELFDISFRYGFGIKEQLGDKTSFTKYQFELYRKFKISTKLNFQLKFTRKEIKSKNLIENELLRFGGANSIRGFYDNSIFANSYNVLNTSVNYYLGDTIYIYTLFDLANYTNNLLDLDEDIYSGGFGFSAKTENGIISMSYSKGNRWGNAFNLKNAKINLIFVTFF